MFFRDTRVTARVDCYLNLTCSLRGAYCPIPCQSSEGTESEGIAGNCGTRMGANGDKQTSQCFRELSAGWRERVFQNPVCE